MQPSRFLLILTSLALIAGMPASHAAARRASAEISPLEDLDRAKVDVQEMKLKQLQLEIEDEVGGNDSGAGPNQNCGEVNIANNSGNDTGTGRIAPHDTTVIVTGDVFNTATCGR